MSGPLSGARSTARGICLSVCTAADGHFPCRVLDVIDNAVERGPADDGSKEVSEIVGWLTLSFAVLVASGSRPAPAANGVRTGARWRCTSSPGARTHHTRGLHDGVHHVGGRMYDVPVLAASIALATTPFHSFWKMCVLPLKCSAVKLIARRTSVSQVLAPTR